MNRKREHRQGSAGKGNGGTGTERAEEQEKGAGAGKGRWSEQAPRLTRSLQGSEKTIHLVRRFLVYSIARPQQAFQNRLQNTPLLFQFHLCFQVIFSCDYLLWTTFLDVQKFVRLDRIISIRFASMFLSVS